MEHCTTCEYLQGRGGEWRCIYRAEDDREKQIAALYTKHGIKKHLAEDGKMNQSQNNRINDGPGVVTSNDRGI